MSELIKINGIGRPPRRTAVTATAPATAPATAVVESEQASTAPEMRPASNGNHAGERKAQSNAELLAELAACEFDAAHPPKPPVALYTLASSVIATPENIGTLYAAKSTGKSAVIGAMIASTMGERERDYLRFASSNPDKLAVLHFDTEQCHYDHDQLIERSLKRAGLTREQKPDWLYSYRLVTETHAHAWEMIKAAVGRAWREHGGIHSIFLDGVADLVGSVNDEEKSNEFVASLHALAIAMHTWILCVIHLNPGSPFKTRGHLGSQLTRKSETNLQLTKVGEITTIWSDQQRHAPIPKATGPCFEWREAAGMQMSADTRRDFKDAEERQELENAVKEVFSKHARLSRIDFRESLQKSRRLSRSEAYKKVSKCLQLGIIKRSGSKSYEKAT